MKISKRELIIIVVAALLFVVTVVLSCVLITGQSKQRSETGTEATENITEKEDSDISSDGSETSSELTSNSSSEEASDEEPSEDPGETTEPSEKPAKTEPVQTQPVQPVVTEPVVMSTATTLFLGESSNTEYITLLNWDNVEYEIGNPDIVDCQWGEWDGDTIPLTFIPMSSGTTYVKVSALGRSECVVIDVTVEMHEHNWSEATCTSPQICTVCGATSGWATGHSWEPATCQRAQYCVHCGAEEGTTLNHSYNPFSYRCYYCDQLEPAGVTAVQNSSLTLPALPFTCEYRGYGSKLYSTVIINSISYEFTYQGDGKVSLMAKMSGTKTYDYKGATMSSRCQIGWKLYDPNGNVLNSGVAYSPEIAVGETFADLEVSLIYNFDPQSPGVYKLILLDVEY